MTIILIIYLLSFYLACNKQESNSEIKTHKPEANSVQDSLTSEVPVFKSPKDLKPADAAELNPKLGYIKQLFKEIKPDKAKIKNIHQELIQIFENNKDKKYYSSIKSHGSYHMLEFLLKNEINSENLSLTYQYLNQLIELGYKNTEIIYKSLKRLKDNWPEKQLLEIVNYIIPKAEKEFNEGTMGRKIWV